MSEAVVGKLSKALAAEAPVLCAWVGMNEPAVAEALAREAFDAVVLDMQHGALDFAGASRAILVGGAGRQAGDRARAGRRVSAGEPPARRRRGGHHRADDQQPRRRQPPRRLHQIPAARRAVVGPARRAAAERARGARLSRRRQRDDPDDRHDRDARRARRARRHPRRSRASTACSSARPTFRSR